VNRHIFVSLISAAVTALAVASVTSGRATTQAQIPGQTAASPDVLYVAGGHLWLQGVDGGAKITLTSHILDWP
jgi:hypothetical protein